MGFLKLLLIVSICHFVHASRSSEDIIPIVLGSIFGAILILILIVLLYKCINNCNRKRAVKLKFKRSVEVFQNKTESNGCDTASQKMKSDIVTENIMNIEQYSRFFIKKGYDASLVERPKITNFGEYRFKYENDSVSDVSCLSLTDFKNRHVVQSMIPVNLQHQTHEDGKEANSGIKTENYLNLENWTIDKTANSMMKRTLKTSVSKQTRQQRTKTRTGSWKSLFFLPPSLKAQPISLRPSSRVKSCKIRPKSSVYRQKTVSSLTLVQNTSTIQTE